MSVAPIALRFATFGRLRGVSKINILCFGIKSLEIEGRDGYN